MTYKIGMTFPTVQYGNVRLEIDADTARDMQVKLTEAQTFMGTAFKTYGIIQDGPDEALERAVKTLAEDLGATVLSTDPVVLEVPSVPSPRDDVKPLWDRPAEGPASPAPSVTVSQSDIDDF